MRFLRWEMHPEYSDVQTLTGLQLHIINTRKNQRSDKHNDDNLNNPKAAYCLWILIVGIDTCKSKSKAHRYTVTMNE